MPGTLVDLSLYGPGGDARATALATTDAGNYAIVGDPMAGTWKAAITYGDPSLPAPTADFT